MSSHDTADNSGNPSKSSDGTVSSNGASASAMSLVVSGFREGSTTRVQHGTLSHETGRAACLERKGANGFTAKDDEYHIGKTRAQTIARWVLEAPVVVEEKGGAGRKRTRKAAPKKCDSKEYDTAAVMSAGS